MTEKDVILMTKSDMTVKTLLSELNKLQLPSQPNGKMEQQTPGSSRQQQQL